MMYTHGKKFKKRLNPENEKNRIRFRCALFRNRSPFSESPSTELWFGTETESEK